MLPAPIEARCEELSPAAFVVGPVVREVAGERTLVPGSARMDLAPSAHLAPSAVEAPRTSFSLTPLLSLLGSNEIAQAASLAGEALLYGAAGLSVAASALTSWHILRSQNGRFSPLSWLATSWIPFVGPGLWFGLGAEPHVPTAPGLNYFSNRYAARRPDPGIPDEVPPDLPDSFRPMLKLSRNVTREPLVGGNRVTTLLNGEGAYPKMLEAIENEPAGGFAHLGMYIIENDAIGDRFAKTLKRAQERGVDERVVTDALGEFRCLFVHPKEIIDLVLERGPIKLKRDPLERHGVRFGRFAPKAGWRNGLPWNVIYHRKFLVTSRKAFIGSVNIGENYLASRTDLKKRHRDTIFCVEGPAIIRIAEAHREDWRYVTGEDTGPARSQAAHHPQGDAHIRVIRSAPNEDYEAFKTVAIAAMSHARHSIRITTGYFAPDRELLSAIKQAALHGVTVELVLSAESNVPAVDLAARQYYEELVDSGVNIVIQPPPFDHSKILLVDDFYVLTGSANLDRRSTLFHSELNLEIYSRRLAAEMHAHFDGLVSSPGARLVDKAWIASWSLGERVASAGASLLSVLY